MLLFRMSADAEARRLTIIGLLITAVVALTILFLAVNPFRDGPTDRLSVTVVVPYVGQGVTIGSPLMMHGVKVGEVTDVSSLRTGKVRIGADLRSRPTSHLTDTLAVDYRPANYFGVTGMNLMAREGGLPLRDGTQIETVPTGNFTLQALLSRLGEITGGVVTPQLISVVNRATGYTDALNPLIETLVTATDAVTKVQTVSTERLLRNATGISVAFPAFVDAATAAGYGFNQGSGLVEFNVSGQEALPGQETVAVPGQPQSQEYWETRSRTTLDLIANSFFGAIGKLQSSHVNELLPAVNLLKMVTDTVPGLLAPEGIDQTLVELRTRYEKLYRGTPEQRALQVHIVLENIPGVQAPINAMGAP